MNEALTAPSATDRDRIRRWFPSLAATETVFLENAGGSQVPGVVADAVRRYMLESYVQLGAGYPEADRADAVVEAARAFVARLVNGEETGRVILGPSCSQLVAMLAHAYGAVLAPGDEVIVVESGHESNVGPWLRLEAHGIRPRVWRLDPESMTCPLEELETMLNERTRIVAFVHVSNLLGEIVDVARVTQMAHAAGARVVVDGVAYAPHRAIDVAAWDVDWYVFSAYKVYAPHMAALYGRHDALAELTGPNHFFVPRNEVPYKYELGGVNHEGCAGLLAMGDYLRGLAHGAESPAPEAPIDATPVDRTSIESAFEIMTACEGSLQARLTEWLADRPGVRIIGPAHGEPSRVGTVSFVHDRLSSRDIVAAAHARGLGIRHGHMYAHRLCSALGIEPEDGVVRVSFVHYNTDEEIERLVAALEPVLRA